MDVKMESGDTNVIFKYGGDICDPSQRFCDEGTFSFTSTEQKRVEDSVQKIYLQESDLKLHRELHSAYITEMLMGLSDAYSVCKIFGSKFLESGSEPAMVLLLGMSFSIDAEWDDRTASSQEFLKTCQSKNGGFGGAPGHLPHLATTYAAVMALITIGSEEALEAIDRATLMKFMYAMKNENGSFSMHVGGENDIRGAYCAVAVAIATGIGSDKLFENTPSWVMRCQTYEGGFAGQPNCEAHGGYTQCGVAALALLGKTHLIEDESLARWLANRQMAFEGGFQGRTGKLVDACYSFWQASSCVIAGIEIEREWKIDPKTSFFNVDALERFVLGVSQNLRTGGFADKPDKHCDLYHTCYALAGLSLAQERRDPDAPIVGGTTSALRPINPLLNVCAKEAEKARSYFEAKPIPALPSEDI